MKKLIYISILANLAVSCYTRNDTCESISENVDKCTINGKTCFIVQYAVGNYLICQSK
jgi:hypothetical protein